MKILKKIKKVYKCPNNIKERWIRRFNWKQRRAYCLANCILSPPILVDYLWFNAFMWDLMFVGIFTFSAFIAILLENILN